MLNNSPWPVASQSVWHRSKGTIQDNCSFMKARVQATTTFRRLRQVAIVYFATRPFRTRP